MTMIEQKAVSLDEQSSMVRHEFMEFLCAQMVSPDMPLPCWVVEVYTDYIVVCEDMGEYYKVPYTLATVNEDGSTESGIRFAPKDQWVKVEKDWIEAKGLDPLVYIGGDVKALGGGKVGGYLVLYTNANDPDASIKRDFFDAKSDLDIEDGERLSVYYDHGLDQTLKTRKIGRGTVEHRDAGLWFEAQLEIRDAYEEYIYKMVEAGKLGWSTGPAQHLVRREPVGKSNHIVNWPIKEASLTPAPAEFRNSAMSLKSLPIHDLESAIKSVPISTPETTDNQPEASAEGGQPSAGGADATVTSGAVTVTTGGNAPVSITIVSNPNGETKMADELQGQTPVSTPAPDNGTSAEIKRLDDRISQLLNVVEKIPAVANSGYVTQDGGTADRNIKSFGDFLLAIKRGDTKRLTEHYNVKALGDSSLAEDQGASGGFLVPAEYNNTLLAVANSTSGIIPLVKQQQVRSPRGFWPSLDQFFAPTAGVGNSAFAGGITATPTAEGGTFTETEPSFEMVEWSINKIGGVIYVTTELMNDSPISIEGLLTQYIGVAVANKEEYYTLRGNGVGQPLGILNSDAAIFTGPDTNDTFAYADAAEILSRFKSVGGQPTWIAHPSTIPDLMRFEVGTGGAVWVANVQGQVPMSLLGYPVRFSEHLPQANNAGHVGLYDLSAYILFRLSNISIAYSEHAAFTSGKVAWRFEERLDGKPALKDDITLADPQGSYTVSPFSLFQD